MTKRHSRPHHWRKGAALVEFVFSLPLIIFVLGCIFFFGVAMKQKLEVQMANYHSVWRAVQEYQSAPETNVLNTQFFGQCGRNINRETWGSTEETFEDFQDKASAHHALAGEMLNEIFDEHYPRRGITERLNTNFNTQMMLYKRFVTEPFSEQFTRDARPWRRSEWRPLQYAVPDKFLEGFEQTLNTMNDPAVADVIKRLYRNGW